MPKDYLTKQDRENLLFFYHTVSEAQTVLENNILTKEEVTNIKKCVTWGSKAIASITARLNPTALKTLNRFMETTKVYIDYASMADILTKKKSSDINAAYEDNKEYLKLVELIMYNNCMNCTKGCSECEFYEEFEKNLIPDMGDVQQINCKYSYKVVMKDERN